MQVENSTRRSRARWATVVVAGLSTAGFVLVGSANAALPSSIGRADAGTPNPKAPGMAAPNKLAPGLHQTIVAQGSMKLENGTPAVPYYGYDGDGRPMVPLFGTNASTAPNEASKTEPDKNTYLVLDGQHGADPQYDYGRHFLYQGHELGQPGYITRVNLDADVDHRVTLLATQDSSNTALPNFDGSTWDPFAQRLLFTAESGSAGGVWQSTLDPANGSTVVDNLQGVLGIGGYEGIQNDSAGNLWIVEDVGGTTINGAKLPNSFIYRFVPRDPGDLQRGGKLQALQVKDAQGNPITFASATVNGTDPLTAAMAQLHTYGSTFQTQWITLHDTSTDVTTTPFGANELAKVKGATPFKRPENGVFRPGIGFAEFYFTETGDTNATSPANTGYGGWGSIMKLSQRKPTADTGKLTMFFAGDQAHTALDNIQFLSGNFLTAVEDGGDLLHTQRDALDSGYVFDTRTNYASGRHPVRWLAEGRDASATIDSGYADAKGANANAAKFQNDGDNEITGIHVSDGNPRIGGILGAKRPQPFEDGWRVFWTQQHGDNNTYEVLPSSRG